ncbi:hypothetical protein MRX96_051060, partial [Rhipicephalus microplus]
PVWNILGRRGGDPDGGQLHHDLLPDMMPRRTDDALLYRSMTPQQLGNPYWRVGRWPDLEERRLAARVDQTSTEDRLIEALKLFKQLRNTVA